MQGKLDKMSRLINEFATARVVPFDDKLIVEYIWMEPDAKASFENFKESIEAGMAMVAEAGCQREGEVGLTAWAVNTYHKRR